MTTTYRPLTAKDKVIDYSLITAGSLVVAVLTLIPLNKFLTWVLTHHPA